MSETVSLVQKKIIYSLLYGNYDIIGIYYARIYTSGKDSKFWLYPGLQGALVFCIEARVKILRFLLFDLKTFEIVFDCELYKKFSNSFEKGTDNFLYFGVNDGYIGFEIPDPEEVQALVDIVQNSDDLVKTRLKEYKPMKENELKEKGRQMIQLLKQRLGSSGNSSVKSEIIINQGELENSINTVDVDDENGRLILTGSGHKGIDKELKKVRGLSIEQNTNNTDNTIFSKYIARNILGSLMRGLVVPKRKIDRTIWEEGEEVAQEEEQEEAPKVDKKAEKERKEREKKEKEKEKKEKEKEKKEKEKEKKEKEKKEKKKKKKRKKRQKLVMILEK
jgi:hypothetical protein